MKKDIIIRSFTGLAFISIIVFALTYNYVAFSAVFFVFLMGNAFEFIRIIRKNNPFNLINIATLIAVALLYFGVVFFNFHFLDVNYWWGLVIPIALLTIGFASGKMNVLFGLLTFLATLFFVLLPFLLAHNIVMRNDIFNGIPLLVIFICIWTYDTAAYLTGSLFGKHLIYEKVSPKKTWEGVIGGLILTSLFALFIAPHMGFENAYTGSLLGIVIVISSTLGDFFESFLKRKVGIKDSGQSLPGHGGFLDRFDSSLFAIPASALFLWVLKLI